MRNVQLTNIKIRNNIPTTWEYLLGRFLILALWLTFLSCNQRKNLVDQELYEGPLSSMDSAITQMSDSGIVIMQMEAPRQNNFENGDREWSKGFYMKWYNKQREVSSFFSANYVYFTKAENIYRAEGNVIVKNIVRQDALNTEELFWNPIEKKFYTDKFVTIKTQDEVHTGEGMEANEGFTEYRIIKPNGTFILEDNPNQAREQSVSQPPTEREQ